MIATRWLQSAAIILAPLFLVAFLASLPALAVSVETSAQGSAPYVTGGFGKDERTAMTRALPDYNLKLEFAQGGRAYVAGAAVRIQGQGVVIDTTVDGPWLLARLPAGSYAITASLNGVDRSENVEVRSGVTRAVFRW
ncbi:carboxypeptidase regulatory-like domain-containing protein [Oceanidesulfovibrio indonesiensis]|uniref:Carboxypeptidase regulatory-like domain-containing protein n=1 Tax=Oceanidesulfovibrio indonesiensis TaxID=54767 RepID=A0A7M3MEL1_9BACT|nr:carboxypeptidase regulatory-like domain-containing protein [Oceanidesulfovibrio indonesiensis]TVM17335.1 carboxypeptidase regulatory-like domain-containing protein [Oceanidesulfovibrio indonesiensis]